MQPKLESPSLVGLSIAVTIVIVWIGSLGLLSSIDLTQLGIGWIVLAVLGRTFIQTGLFIVGHDAIHGVVVPSDRRLNDAIGHLVVTLYAFLSYPKLAHNHALHHRHPGQSSLDPDFHDGTHQQLWSWYLTFMLGYMELRQFIIQLLGMGGILAFLYFGLHSPILNMALFWVLPIFLSTLQLFVFGTYLPHRSTNPSNTHNATSSNYPLLLSFFSCYHFGYHWEHHEYPFLPWYRLPAARRHSLQSPQFATDGKSSMLELIAK
jgi:beta-carotene/zeaxanthin 4-ketolase